MFVNDLLHLFLLLLFGYLAADAVKPCKEERCVPNCKCNLPEADICAEDYGNWGWVVPEGYDNIHPEVSDRNGSLYCLLCFPNSLIVFSRHKN